MIEVYVIVFELASPTASRKPAGSGMSDEIWASSAPQDAIAAASAPENLSPMISSIDRSLRDIDTQPTSQDSVARVLFWLRGLPRTVSPANAQALVALSQRYEQWTQEMCAIHDALWFQVAEIGAWLAVHGHPMALKSFQSAAVRPATVPHQEAFCDHDRQVQFAIRLFDALCGSSMAVLSHATVPLVVEAFVTTLVRVMKDYEFIFLHHVAQPLATHIQEKCRVLPDTLTRAAHAIIDARMKNWEQDAASIAVAAILLAASSEGTALQSIQSLVVETLQRIEVFPHIHRAIAVLAAPLQAAPLTFVSSPLVHQFLLLRIVHLPLASARLLIQQDGFKRLCERYQECLYRSQLSERDIDVCLRMMEASTNEIKAAMDANPVVSSSILRTMRSRSEKEAFQPLLIAFLDEAEGQTDQSQPAFPAIEYLANLYDSIACGIQVIAHSPSNQIVLDCFVTLCRLEFARECCASPQRNATMVQLTQRVEGLIETAPDATLSAVTASVLQQHQPASNVDCDVVFGWACFAVGLIVQRKLRVVLFQASDDTRRNALAVVFSGLYHGLEPLNSFAQRFIGFALSSLGQFVSVYEVFPFYLQETLRRFPTDVPKDQAASVLGTVFGALYYTNPTQALTEEEKKIEATAAETRHAMILWALRQSKQRAQELLKSKGDATAQGLYGAELFLEVAKMAPVELIPVVAREMEALVHLSSEISERMLHEVKTRVFNAISTNCEAEKRAWLAAWFLDLSAAYPSSPESATDVVADAQALKDTAVTASSQAVSRL